MMNRRTLSLSLVGASLALVVSQPLHAQDPAVKPKAPTKAKPGQMSRKQVLAMYDKAAQWLLKTQNKNGSWGAIPGTDKKGELGMTGLAVMGLAQAPKELRGKYKESCQKAAEWISKHRQKDGSYAHPKAGLVTYRTALSMMALKRVDAKKYKDGIAGALKWLRSAQFSESNKVDKSDPSYGGWGYDKTGTKPDADLGNVSIALQALKEAGLSEDDPAYKRALEFVTRCQNNTETNKTLKKIKPKNDGGFFYDPGLSRNKSASTDNKDGTVSYESYASITYAGLMSLLYCKPDLKDPRVKAAFKWIKNNYTLDKNAGLGIRNPKPKADQQGMYYFYMSFAKSLDASGKIMIETKKGKRNWVQDLAKKLKKNQKPAGFWINEASPRWWEGNPLIPTTYMLNALNHVAKHVK